MEIFNVGGPSINRYLLVSDSHRLLFDAGYPGSLHDMGREMRKTGFGVRDIDFVMVSHFHIDHAGALQEIKNTGAKFILFDVQHDYIGPMEQMVKGKWNYSVLQMEDNVLLQITDARKFLASIHITGTVLPTPGHTDDSISLLLDGGEAFTGDLYPESNLSDDTVDMKNSWNLLRKSGARMVFPAHGGSYQLSY
jgi:endoribonuclease LACTB2